MKFAEPLWLLAGAAACALLIWTWLRYDARQRKSLATFAASHLHAQLTASFSTARRNWQRAFFFASVALLFVALARPQAGFRWEEVKRKGVEILFAVDTSKSMLTPDAKPDRLTRAKLAIDDFVGHLDGDGVGLVAFAGNAFLQCPITLDYNAFNESLDAIDTNTIPRGGTDISSAISEAQAALANRPGSDKILILLTDGEDLEGSAIDAAKAAAKMGLKIYTVGVGSSNGDLIPLPAESGGGFVKDSSGQYVKSHLDETALKAIAEATGGAYAPLGAQGQGLDQIYQSYIAPLTKHDLASRQQKIYIERFQWPLTAALVLLLASQIIGTRKNVKRRTATFVPPVPMMPRKRMTQMATAATFAAAFLLIPASQAHASVSGAEAAYKKGDYANAQKEYTAAAIKQPDKNVLQFNAGAAAYKAGQYSQAAEDFQKSLGAQQSADPEQLAAQQDAYYNLGNTLYRTGQKTEQTKADDTIKTWEQAIKSYDSALQLRKDDADAKYNRDLVQKKLDDLKKKQQQQNQDQKNQDQKDQQKQDQKNQSGQGSDNKDQQDKQDQAKNDKDQKGKSGQNSNDKDVAKNDQQKQDGQQNQPKDGQDKKDQANNQGQGQQDQQKDPGQQPDQNQTAQNQGKQDQNSGSKPDQQQGQQANNSAQGQQPQGDQPKDKESNGNGQVAQNQSPDQNSQAQDQRANPGDMSKQEAKQLLDSLRGEQKQLPGTPLARGEANNQNDQPLKDW
jgi:Ca-activated chloride channel family protein